MQLKETIISILKNHSPRLQNRSAELKSKLDEVTKVYNEQWYKWKDADKFHAELQMAQQKLQLVTTRIQNSAHGQIELDIKTHEENLEKLTEFFTSKDETWFYSFQNGFC